MITFPAKLDAGDASNGEINIADLMASRRDRRSIEDNKSDLIYIKSFVFRQILG